MFREPVLLYTGLGLGWAWVKLSPVDKFDKLKSGVIALGWIIIFCYFLTAFPVPESPKAFRYKGGLSPLLPLSLCLVVELSMASDSFGW